MHFGDNSILQFVLFYGLHIGAYNLMRGSFSYYFAMRSKTARDCSYCVAAKRIMQISR